jgi:hypothetical protein
MTQPSKEIVAKQLILQAIEHNAEDPHSRGLRYYKLYDLVKEEIGEEQDGKNTKASVHTFEKYLLELEKQDHSIRRDPDPKDSRAKIIVANPEVLRAQLIFLDGITRIRELTKMSPPTDHDWRKDAETVLKGKVRLTQKEEDELFAGPAYKWMLASNELLSIAISIYKKTNEEDLRKKFKGCKDPLDLYFRATASTLQTLPRERVKIV